MRDRHLVTAAAMCSTILIAACSGSPLSPDSLSQSSRAAGTPQGLPDQAAYAATATMQAFPSGAPLSGSSSLLRTSSGVSMTLHAEGLTGGNAYTVWFVAFNEPSACVGPCDVSDVLANRGLPAVRFAAGHVIGADGRANFGGRLATGETGGPPCAAGPALGSCGPGLLDSRTAIVHLVVRSHGAAIPEVVNEQISSFNGGCPPNACANVQFAVFDPAS